MLDVKGVTDSQRLAENGVVIPKLPSGVCSWVCGGPFQVLRPAGTSAKGVETKPLACRSLDQVPGPPCGAKVPANG